METKKIIALILIFGFFITMLYGLIYYLYMVDKLNRDACHTCGYIKPTDSDYNSNTHIKKIECDKINYIYYFYPNATKCDKWGRCYYNGIDSGNPITVCTKW
jgi:hypothetical protein